MPPAPADERSEPASHQAPSYRARSGRVEAAVWSRGPDEGRTAFSVTLQRNYQDRAGKWQRTASFDNGDMLPATKALEECNAWIQKERHHTRAEQA